MNTATTHKQEAKCTPLTASLHEGILRCSSCPGLLITPSCKEQIITCDKGTFRTAKCVKRVPLLAPPKRLYALSLLPMQVFLLRVLQCGINGISGLVNTG